MVSSRAYSSPVPQPASRHDIKPFSILLSRRQVGVYSWSWRMELYISSCHHSQHSLRSRIQIVRWSAAWGRRGIRCEAVSKSPYDLRWGRQDSECIYEGKQRIYSSTLQLQLSTPTKQRQQAYDNKNLSEGRGGFSRPVERRKKRRMRPDFDASAFHPVT